MDLKTPQGTESVRNGEGLSGDSKRESSRPTQFTAESCDSVAGGSIRDRNTGRSRTSGTAGRSSVGRGNEIPVHRWGADRYAHLDRK